MVRLGEDRLLWSRLAKQGKFKNLSKSLGRYRLLGNSLDHTINPFDKVIYEFRNKMCSDEQITDTDVEMYNQIYLYSKKYTLKSDAGKIYRSSIVEKVYNQFKIVLGEKCAELIAVNLVNINCYCRMRKHIK